MRHVYRDVLKIVSEPRFVVGDFVSIRKFYTSRSGCVYDRALVPDRSEWVYWVKLAPIGYDWILEKDLEIYE